MNASDPSRLSTPSAQAPVDERAVAVLFARVLPPADLDDATLERLRARLRSAPVRPRSRTRELAIGASVVATSVAVAFVALRVPSTGRRHPDRLVHVVEEAPLDRAPSAVGERARTVPALAERAWPAADCARFVAGLDTRLCRTLTLGREGTDAVSGVAIADDGTVVVAGTFTSADLLGVRPKHLLGGGSGAVIRSGARGNVLSVTRAAQELRDLELHRPTGEIVVAADFGVARLGPEADAVRWRQPLPGGGYRVAVGRDGVVAALDGESHVTVLDPAGARIGGWRQPDQLINDVAVDGRNGLVLVTGYNPKKVTSCGEIPFLRAYGYDGTLRWTAYDFGTDDIARLVNSACPRARGMRVAIGRDDKLYFLGESVGQKSVFRLDPRDLTIAAPNVAVDDHNDITGALFTPSVYVGRFEPATGKLEVGQFVVARLKDRRANTIRAFAVDADEQGNVLVGGESACCMPNRDGRRVNGLALERYEQSDGYYVLLSSDLRSRLAWNGWSTLRSGPPKAVAIGARVLAVGSDQVSISIGVRRLNTQLAPPPGAGAHLRIGPAP